MTGSPSFLDNWINSDFWKTGAFLVSHDGEHVTLGRGGTIRRETSFDVTDGPVFYLKDFYTDSFLSYTPDSYVTVSRANVLAWVKHLSDTHSHISPVANDDDIYEKDFHVLKSLFNEELQKVVLISRETYFPFEKEHSIRRLLRKAFEFGTGTPYGFWYQGYGVIGSTPEVLFHVNKNELSTFALAGTARAGEEEMLLQSKKDRHEHDLVIRDISEKLAPFCENVYAEETGIHPFKNIVHLKTNIKARIRDDIKWDRLITTLSPTAALGGYPKEQSLRFLSQTNYARKYNRVFGSAFGMISREEKHIVVAIRNVQWEDNHLFIESGGGVVPESDLQKEIEEFRMKRNTIRNHYL